MPHLPDRIAAPAAHAGRGAGSVARRHLNGPIAKALVAKAPELFAKAPAIEPLEVLGIKHPAA